MDSIHMSMAPLGWSERVIQSTRLLFFYVKVNEQLRHVRTNELICGSETRHMAAFRCVFGSASLLDNSFCKNHTAAFTTLVHNVHRRPCQCRKPKTIDTSLK